MVGVTFLAALISAGTVGAPGVFIVPLQKEFGWSTAEISSALSDPLHPVRADGAIRRRPAEPLRPAQRDLGGAADRGRRIAGIACDDAGLAADAAVGRRDRDRHRHDRAGARRHHCRALVRGPAWPRGRYPDRERRDRATRLPATARDA